MHNFVFQAKIYSIKCVLLNKIVRSLIFVIIKFFLLQDSTNLHLYRRNSSIPFTEDNTTCHVAFNENVEQLKSDHEQCQVCACYIF